VVGCNSVGPIPGVTHTSVAEHRQGLPYGARRVALVHCGADVLAQADRFAAELGAVIPADGDTLAI